MFAKVHPPEDVQAGNRGSCADLARYLEKETGEGQTFFSHTQDNISAEEVIANIDHNKKGLGLNDAKFFMLSLNPSENEQRHLIGRDVANLSELSGEERKAVFEKLQAFTRSAMNDYAVNFGRENIKSGADLMYYARIETERTYKKTDEAVRNLSAKIGAEKPGLNLHVHIIVSRKSLDGKTKLSPGAASTGNTWELNGQTVKRGFNHENWKVKVQDTFNKMFEYQSLKDETYLPKPTPEREAVINKVTNPDLKDLLTNEQFTAANQIVAALHEKGYTHHVRKGIHTFTNDNEVFKITHKELKIFESPVSDEHMKDIAGRFDMGKFENNFCTYHENGLHIKNISFSTKKPDKIQPEKEVLQSVNYRVIYDEQNKITVPLSAVKKYAYENKINLVKSELNKEVLLSKIKNSDLKNLLQTEHFTAANQIIVAMREKGYEHSVKKGIHTFTSPAGEQVSIRHKDLNRFPEKVNDETMKDIIDRFNMFKFKQDFETSGYYEQDLYGKRIEFYTYVKKEKKEGETEADPRQPEGTEKAEDEKLNPEQEKREEPKVLKFVQYDVLYDKQTKTTVPISQVRKYAYENGINLYDRFKHSYAVRNVDLRECLQNPELKTVRQLNNEMRNRGYIVSYGSESKSYTYTKGEEYYRMSRSDIRAFTNYAKEKYTHRGQNRDVSSRVAGTVGHKIAAKIKNEILGDSFRTERMLSKNVQIAVKAVTNPAALKMMILKKAVSFLNPLKEM